MSRQIHISIFTILLIGSVGLAHVVNQANIYLPFEGEDHGLNSVCWLNRGHTGRNEGASRLGSTPPGPSVAAAGVKGQAYDGTVENAGGSYMWGEFGALSPTLLERAINDIQSFTITGWIKSPADARLDNQRILSTLNFELNYHSQTENHGYLATRVGYGTTTYYTSTNKPDEYGIMGQWVFIAVTWDGTKAGDQLTYYYGGKTRPVTLDAHITTAVSGTLSNDSHGGNLWLGNSPNFNSTTNLFRGYIDELRIFSSADDGSGALDIDALEEIRQYDLYPVIAEAVLQEARLHFPFEGQFDDVNDLPHLSECWRNRGITGTGQGATTLGTVSAAYPAITSLSGGLKGQAYDGTDLTPMMAMSTYRWGETSWDTAMEAALTDVWSMTITGWIKTDTALEQGRILNNPAGIEINYIGPTAANPNQNRIAARVMNSGFRNATNATDRWGSVGLWRFFAVTYDGTASQNNIQFFYGDESTEVRFDKGESFNGGKIPLIGSGGDLYIGNANPNGNRPFVGYIDELRIWSSDEPSSAGVLSIDQLEAVRRYDLGLLDTFMPGDINRDGRVDIEDLLLLAGEWLACAAVDCE